MALTFTSWTNYTDEDGAKTLGWSSTDAIRGHLLRPHAEAVRQAIKERYLAVGGTGPTILQAEIPLGGPALEDWPWAVQLAVSTLITAYVNHTDSSGDWSGQAAIPAWTEAEILADIGAARISSGGFLSADWIYQQYQILNLLKWTKKTAIREKNRYASENDYFDIGFIYYAMHSIAPDAIFSETVNPWPGPHPADQFWGNVVSRFAAFSKITTQPFPPYGSDQNRHNRLHAGSMKWAESDHKDGSFISYRSHYFLNSHPHKIDLDYYVFPTGYYFQNDAAMPFPWTFNVLNLHLSASLDIGDDLLAVNSEDYAYTEPASVNTETGWAITNTIAAIEKHNVPGGFVFQ
jgi:hypothetical protein